MSVADLALHRWPGILGHFSIDQSFLVNRHGPCPVCGGRDRFRFDDKEGRGTWFCSHCGSGDGFKLLELLKGWSFREAAKEIEAVVGIIPATVAAGSQPGANKLAICRRIWAKSARVVPGDPVALYLARRCGINAVPNVIRCHPRLAYRHDE